MKINNFDNEENTYKLLKNNSKLAKKVSRILTHFSAVGATLTCLGIGGVLVMDAATTSPTRFSALIEGKESSIYPYLMAMRALSLPKAMHTEAPEPVEQFVYAKQTVE